MDLKINQKYFYNCLFLWKTKTCLKGTVARDFLPLIFFHELTGFHGKNALKIAEVKLSSCGLEVADCKKNCDCGIAELRLQSNISLKVAELRLRKYFLLLAELRLRTQKKVARAHLWYSNILNIYMFVHLRILSICILQTYMICT
jgi:hypothetical protein